MTIGVRSKLAVLQLSLQPGDEVSDQVNELGRREDGFEGGGEGEGGAGVLQLLCKVVVFAAEQEVLNRFRHLAALAEAIGVAVHFMQVGVQAAFAQSETRDVRFFSSSFRAKLYFCRYCWFDHSIGGASVAVVV